MSKHYSRILSAARYQAELEAYINYISGKASRQLNIGNGKKRLASTTLYVLPFAFPATSNTYLQQSAATAAWTEYEGEIGGHAVATLPANTSAVKIRGARAARIIVVTGRSPDGVVKTSHITSAKYLSYGGTSRSVPFGRAGATDTLETVFEAIKSVLAPTGSANKVYLEPEKVA